LSSRHIPLVVLLLLASALPAYCVGVDAGVSAAPEEVQAAVLSLDADLQAPAEELDLSVVPAGRVVSGSQGALAMQARGLARLTQRLRDPRVVGQALLASYVTARITGLPNFTSASARVAGATFGAAMLCEGLQMTVGRTGPGVTAGVPGGLDAAFPSEHTTVGFALASAIAAESQARWVPWVVYPAAAVVGLAQAREVGDGLGAAAAGAALGYWTGRKLDRIERSELRIFDRARFLVRGSPRDFRVGFKARF
jgi:hypothetical protein